MKRLSLDNLPRYVLFAFITATVGIALVAVSSGWRPHRNWSGVVLPLLFGALLAAIALACVVSGNTLMHHYRTGTVRRESSPATFWWIVTFHILISVGLFILGAVRWAALR